MKKPLIALVLVFSLVLLVHAEEPAPMIIDAFTDQACSDDSCKTNFYSYERYWQDEEGDWETINENFHDCSEGETTRYCTNEYYFGVSLDDNGTIILSRDDETFSMQLTGFLDQSLTFDPTRTDNLVTYEDIIENVDVRYYYFPTLLKEELILHEPLEELPEEDFDLVFQVSGSLEDFVVLPSTICDANNTCRNIPQEVTEDEIRVTVPVDFLSDPLTQYPVIIDPTIALNASYVSWNGHIKNETNETTGVSNYTRTSTGEWIKLAIGGVALPGFSQYHYGAIEWNLSSIPEGSVIYSAILQLRLEPNAFGNPSYQFNITQLEKTHSMYGDEPTSCQGNCQFYSDMHNGTVYNSSTPAGKTTYNFTFNSAGLAAIQSSLISDIFGVGLVTTYSPDMSVGSKDNTNASKRPVLTITYGVNGTSGDDAIQIGINHSLPNNPISSGKQIYLVNAAGQHFLGTFDKVTTLNNQTWAFNYVVPTEAFIGMPSLLRILNVWENQSLTSSEIISQVELFINATRY